jgi:RNA polymerase subunit RPABC4/transcription elongation factor Spt4
MRYEFCRCTATEWMIMNKCKYCNVFIDENLNKCPLCHQIISDNQMAYNSVLYPIYDIDKSLYVKRIIFKIWLFLSIAGCCTVILLNVLTLNRSNNLWFLYIVVPTLYLWLLVKNTILSKMHTGGKILLQIISVSGLILVIDLNSGFYRWSVNIVIPIMVAVSTIFITVIVYSRKMLWNEYIGYAITLLFLGFIPVILYFIGVSNSIWASGFSALYSFLTLLFMFIFSNKRFKNEFKRRLHF